MNSSKNQHSDNHNNPHNNMSSDQKQLSTEDILSHVNFSHIKTNTLSDEEKETEIAKHFASIMEVLGLDLEDSNLMKSPQRVAKMYVREIFRGLNMDYFPQITTMKNKTQYDQMILVKKVKIITFCEHHFVTIHGRADIAYIPREYIVGLSKINRIAHFFSKRPQIQERLTNQIADALCYILDTPHVAVSISAKHYCVAARGIEDTDSVTNTYDLRGDFKDNSKMRMDYMQALSES